MTIICTEQQKKEIINAPFCPMSKCQLYSREHGAKYETCEQCREENIEWIIERSQGEWEEINERIGIGEDNIYTSFKCPFCGYIDLQDNNFCGNCGTRMKHA